MGVPTEQQGPSEAVVQRIVDGLAAGRSMRAICADADMPARTTVWRWSQGDDELGARIREAREVGYHDLAERALADVEACDDPIKARVLFDARRLYLGKLSNAFAEKPVQIGVAVNVDAGSDFGAFADALEGAAAARARLFGSTRLVDSDGTPGSVDPTRGLAGVAGVGRAGLGQDPDGG